MAANLANNRHDWRAQVRERGTSAPGGAKSCAVHSRAEYSKGAKDMVYNVHSN